MSVAVSAVGVSVEEAIEPAMRVARAFCRRLPQHLHDDVESAALEAALRAARAFDRSRTTVHPEVFVGYRVQLALIDWWRSEFGRRPGDARRARLGEVSLDQPIASGEAAGESYVDVLHAPSEVSLEERDEALAALSVLPPRLRQVAFRRFFERARLREIAEELEVTESRASQLLNDALLRMRRHMRQVATR